MAGVLTSVGQAAITARSFEKDVRPILKAHCFHCHGEDGHIEGDLDVRLKRLLEKGGEQGPAIVPGKPHESLLIELLKEGEMPKKAKPLKPEEISILEDWIAQGAKTLRPEPEKVEDASGLTAEERAWWAFQPIARPEVPSSELGASGETNPKQHPVDAFIRAELAEKKLALSPEADRATLIRRVYFDLLGLPPTSAQVEAFVKDSRPDAWERLVDELLASPHYGERWGRHWLDVAGYADSEGYNDNDTDRPDAWHYRDYVINAFNANMPFDQFIREQLAGDEMVPYPIKYPNTETKAKLAATGFLRMVPDGTGTEPGEAKIDAANATVTESVKIISSALLGMTVGCAECHDHRFDPILQKDFYRLRAVLEPALDPKAWREPRARRLSTLNEEEQKQTAAIEKEAKAIEAELPPKYEAFRDWIFEKEVAALPAEIRDKAREAGLARRNAKDPKDPKALTSEQAKLIESYPGLRVSASPSILNLFLEKYDRAEELATLNKETAARAAAVRAKKPKEDFIRVLAEPAAFGNTGKTPATFLFKRGNRQTPGEQIPPGDLTALGDQPVDIALDDPTLPSTGRRLALARHLTSGTHPLVMRVLVNRIWMNHFGRGIVNTPGDFGRQGEKPTHPALLDWLASEFAATGWDLKKMHRLILTSQTWRQASQQRDDAMRVDPGTTLLWRYPVRRMDAEAIRDSVLAVCGTLNPTRGGAPVTVSLDANNQAVVGGAEPTKNGQEFRRSVYVMQKRSQLPQALSVFDQPAMEPNCEIRNCSTVAPQSLLMMNSAFIIQQSEKLAQRVIAQAGDDRAQQARLAWQACFSAMPSDAQIASLADYLAQQTRLLETAVKNLPPPPPPASNAGGTRAAVKPPPPPPAPNVGALASLCQTLLESNRFLYVD